MIKVLGWAVFIVVVFAAGCFLITAGDGDESLRSSRYSMTEKGLGKVVLISHEEECYGDQCYSQEYDYDYGNRGDNSRNRERGAFSPGPFDDSPVDAFNNACLPGATCYYERNPDGQGSEQQPGQ